MSSSSNMIQVSPIKSLQYGTIAMGSADTSKTATITSITTTKSILSWLGGVDSLNGGFAGNSNQYRLELTNATTVTATRSSAVSANTITIGFLVTEYN